MAATIGVDIGGTKVAAGVVDESGRILAKVRRDTPAKSSTATVDAIIDVVKELATDHQVEAVGLAAAGFVDEKRATVLFAANVANWRNEPLRDHVQRRTGLRAV